MATTEAQQFAELKQQIDTRRRERAQLEGALTAVHRQLKDEFGTDDPAVAAKKIAAMRDRASVVRKRVAVELVALQKEVAQ
jgi:predicted  nucleic acid-binding Zn-ribbon protein